MGKSHELNEFECEQIIGLQIAGRTHEAISHLLKISKSTVIDTITWHANSNNGLSAKRIKRSLLMNNNNHQTLKKITKKNNWSSLSEIHHEFQNLKNKKVSQDTIRKTLHQMGIYSRIAALKPLLTKSQHENRLK